MESPMDDRPLIIGVGNTDRGDDGAGIIVARHLRARVSSGILVVEQAGAGLDLIHLWQEAKGNAIFVVDAICCGFPPGTIKRFAVSDSPPPMQFGVDYSSHSFGLAQALELAAVLCCLPGQMILYGIEGACYDPGAPLSPVVQSAACKVAARIIGEIAAIEPRIGHP